MIGATYQVQVIGPAWQGYLPSMGIDDHGRVAGCTYYYGEQTYTRAWTYDPAVGYLLSGGENSTVGGVSPDGTIAGSYFGVPTILDWAGNPTLLFPNISGAFMSVNRNDVCAGYIIDHNDNMTQKAVLYDAAGNWTVLGQPGMAGSAAYGINDNGLVVGHATDDTGVHAFLWNGQMTYLPAPEGYGAIAVGVNNNQTMVGYAIAPDDQFLPMIWTNTPGVTYKIPELPSGYSDALASAVNDKGTVVGSMWAPGGRPHAFVYTPERGILDLNALRWPNVKGYTLVSAGAINSKGQIVGIAELHDNYLAFVATPIGVRPNRGAVDH